MLDVRRLRVLREVAARGSFSAAAEALSYTQSAVSQQMAVLEREAGTKLVERNARGIRLTDAGEALVRHTDAVLATLAEAEAELEAIAGLRGGRVRLASFPTAGAAIVPQAIATFRARHPAVELSLIEAEPEDSVPKLKAGDIDVALIFEPNGVTEQADSGLDRRPLLEDPMYLALPRDHPVAHRARVKLKELSGDPWISPTTSCPCWILAQRACMVAGFEPHVAFESDDYLAIQGLVAAGVGVALIPDLALTTVREDIVIRALTPDVPGRQVLAATLPGYRSPACEAMLGVLRETSVAYVAEREALVKAS